jgi:UDP-glucuronate decarboxylase
MNKFIKNLCERVYRNCTVSELKNKTILVTGANGLIGGFIADFLCFLNTEYSYNIKIVLTSLSESPKRLKHHLFKDNIMYISQDLSENYKEYEYEIDYCFFCAGYAQPSKFLSNTFKTFFLNTHGLYNTMKNVFKNKNARGIFLSSSEIYTMNETESSHKEADEIHLSLEHKRNSYIFGKIAGEMIMNDFKNLGFDTATVRVSLCYGPGHLYNDTRVMSDITRKATSEESTIKLFDDGSALRRYLHISDFLVMLLNITIRGKEEVYNVGGVEEVSIYDMASHIGNFFNKEIQTGISHNKVSTSAPKRVWVSLDRYEKEFGKVSSLVFEDGLEDYLSWFQEEFGENIYNV